MLIRHCEGHWFMDVLGSLFLGTRVPGFSVNMHVRWDQVGRWLDSFNFRTCMFLRYTRQASRQVLQPFFDRVEHVAEEEPAFEVTQSGVPYRQFCKQSMYLYRAAQQYLSGGVTESSVLNVFLLVALFRGWFNRMDRFQEFTIALGGLDVATFSAERAKGVLEELADKHRGEDENRRSAAYIAIQPRLWGQTSSSHPPP